MIGNGNLFVGLFFAVDHDDFIAVANPHFVAIRFDSVGLSRLLADFFRDLVLLGRQSDEIDSSFVRGLDIELSVGSLL